MLARQVDTPQTLTSVGLVDVLPVVLMIITSTAWCGQHQHYYSKSDILKTISKSVVLQLFLNRAEQAKLHLLRNVGRTQLEDRTHVGGMSSERPIHYAGRPVGG